MTNVSFTAYRLRSDGSLDMRANLNNQDELGEWLADMYRKCGTVQVTRDQDGNTLVMTDDGEKFATVRKFKQ